MDAAPCYWYKKLVPLLSMHFGLETAAEWLPALRTALTLMRTGGPAGCITTMRTRLAAIMSHVAEYLLGGPLPDAEQDEAQQPDGPLPTSSGPTPGETAQEANHSQQGGW